MRRSSARPAKSNVKGYSTHTISSAIKADYGKPDVRFKLSELNSTVDSRVEDSASKIIADDQVQTRKSRNQFVIRGTNNKLIGRSPGSHQVLSDGLVLLRKSRDRSQKRTKSSHANKSNSQNRSQSAHRSQSLKNKSIKQARSHSPSLTRQNNAAVQGIVKKKRLKKSFYIAFNKKIEIEGNPDLNDTSKLYSSIKKYDTTFGK
jgi:hypothetical protein